MAEAYRKALGEEEEETQRKDSAIEKQKREKTGNVSGKAGMRGRRI